MSTTPARRPLAPAPPAPSRGNQRPFLRRVKRWSVGFTAAGVGLTWALVSQNAVGVTNTGAAQPTTAPAPTPHRASIPAGDFFGPPGAQPQPIINGNSNTVGRPVVRGGTS